MVPTWQICSRYHPWSYALICQLPTGHWDSLQAFRQQVIILKHMDTLMNMDTISSDQHLKDLCWLYDHTESHVRSLRSLGIEAASYGALLSPVLLSKQPPQLWLTVSRKVSDSNLDMDALLSTFKEELTAWESEPSTYATNQGETTPHILSTFLWYPQLQSGATMLLLSALRSIH